MNNRADYQHEYYETKTKPKRQANGKQDGKGRPPGRKYDCPFSVLLTADQKAKLVELGRNDWLRKVLDLPVDILIKLV